MGSMNCSTHSTRNYTELLDSDVRYCLSVLNYGSVSSHEVMHNRHCARPQSKDITRDLPVYKCHVPAYVGWPLPVVFHACLPIVWASRHDPGIHCFVGNVALVTTPWHGFHRICACDVLARGGHGAGLFPGLADETSRHVEKHN